MNLRQSFRHFLQMFGHAMNGGVHQRLDTLERNAEAIEIHLNSLEEGQASLLQAAIHSVETLHSITRPKLVDTSQSAEALLIAHLYSYVPARKAAGSSTAFESLTAAGFEIVELEDCDAGFACVDLERPFDPQVRRMRASGYPWHLVLYRSEQGAGYYANQSAAIPDAKGTALFFREYKVFAEGLGWCSACLPAANFRPEV